MSEQSRHVDATLPLQITRQVDAICDEFEAALGLGGNLDIEPFLNRVDEQGRQGLLTELALLVINHLKQQGSSQPREELLRANLGLRVELSQVLELLQGAPTERVNEAPACSVKSSGLLIRCPLCHCTIEMIVDAPLVDIGCPNCGGRFGLVNEAESTRDATTLTKLGHFELIERLGMGEFGTVWKARDTILDRTVALKIPRRQQLDAESIEKFMREARAAAQLRHPNIISTHEVGRHQENLYIVNDYIRGVPLADMMADHRLAIHESLDIATKVADALEHAHQSGVVHRDLKPSNILIDDLGEPHLMDFGLAKRKETGITVTTEGAILGTPAYMSPEQARGESSHVDGRSDLYSLGVILFQMLTGELPFRGSLRMLLQKVILDDPPGPRTLDSRVPKDLDTICLKCLEKDPARRYARAADLAADLRRYTRGEPIAARRIGAAGRAWRWARRNRAITLSLAATMLTLLGATMSSTFFAWQAAQSAVRADQQAMEVSNTLYESLLQEIRLTSAVREQGYGEDVLQLIDRVQKLGTARVDRNELRRQLVHTMGDFVAYFPLVIEPAQGEITSICLSGHGRDLFVGLKNGRILLYDPTSGNSTGELTPLANTVSSIEITADDDELIAVDLSGAARVWQRNGSDWKQTRDIQCGANPSSAFISFAGDFVASLNGAMLEVWDLATGSQLHSFSTKASCEIRNVAFDSAQRRLAATFVDQDADSVGWLLWELDSGELLHHKQMPTLGNSYDNGIDFAPGGKQLAIGFDEVLQVYRLSDYQPTNLYGIDSTKALAFSPTNTYLAATNIRGQLTLWNSATNRQVATLYHLRRRKSRDDLVFSMDGTHLASSNADTVQVWDLSRADEKTVMIGHEGGIPCAAFDPQSELLATGGKDDMLRFWNPSTGGLIRSKGLGEAIQTLAYSPDGKLLAVGCTGSTGAPHLRLIDMATHEVIFEQSPKMGNVHSLDWADGADKRYLAGCGAQGVTLWMVSTEGVIHMQEVVHQDIEWCLATIINPDAQLMIWAEDNWRLRAWDITKNKEISLSAPAMLQGWNGVAFLPDGESIIYVSRSGIAEVWNVREDRHVDSFGDVGTFTAPHIALSPNGQWFAALSEPDVVSVWHLPSQQHLYSLRPATGTIWSMAWDPSSEHLAVGQSDWGLAVWHLPIIRQKLAVSGLPWTD